jgi:hypothetical protein
MMTKLICGTPEYWRDRKEAFRLVNHLGKAGTPKMDDKTFFADLQAARTNPTVREILHCHGQLSLLHPDFDVTTCAEGYDEIGHDEERVYLTDQGVVRITETSLSDEEGSRFERFSYLNGLEHDIDGQPAAIRRVYNYIPEEKYLDEDTVESWLFGVQVSETENTQALHDRLTPTERVYFGWAEDDDLKAIAAE